MRRNRVHHSPNHPHYFRSPPSQSRLKHLHVQGRHIDDVDSLGEDSGDFCSLITSQMTSRLMICGTAQPCQEQVSGAVGGKSPSTQWHGSVRGKNQPGETMGLAVVTGLPKRARIRFGGGRTVVREGGRSRKGHGRTMGDSRPRRCPGSSCDIEDQLRKSYCSFFYNAHAVAK